MAQRQVAVDTDNVRLFSFVVITDSHIKGDASPSHSGRWSTNELAQVRTRRAVELINGLAPDFVVHLGDFVHPIPQMPEYDGAAEIAKSILAGLQCPLHTIPGNHDIGDKNVSWMPAPIVDEYGLSRFEHHFGSSYSAFTHNDIRFVLINSPILNSGLAVEDEQRDWFECELAGQDGQRIYLFSHYPPYIQDADEREHYDNIALEQRKWLLELIDRHGVEAVFAGHVHNFFYNRYAGADLYVVPSTTFVRQDYSELFQIGTADGAEFGRNDTGKLGFLVVHVCEQGHEFEFVRLDGTESRYQESRALILSAPKAVAASVGVDLQYPWSKTVELPYNYMLEPFERRTVRNDYPLLALWDLGIWKVRIPVNDLISPTTLDRIALLQDRGFQFNVFSYGTPDQFTIDLIAEHKGLLASWEIVAPGSELASIAKALPESCGDTVKRTFISIVETSAGAMANGTASGRATYFTRHGFEPDGVVGAIESLDLPANTGLTVRVGESASPWSVVLSLDELSRERDIPLRAFVQLASERSATAMVDDRLLANRVAETVMAASVAGSVEVLLDTFVDVDRGYFVRHGLVDRRYNRRPAGAVFRNLQRVLSAESALVAHESPRQNSAAEFRFAESSRALYVLVLPNYDCNESVHLDSLCLPPSAGATGTASLIHLERGSQSNHAWTRSNDEADRVTFEQAPSIDSPALLRICRS